MTVREYKKQNPGSDMYSTYVEQDGIVFLTVGYRAKTNHRRLLEVKEDCVLGKILLAPCCGRVVRMEIYRNNDFIQNVLIMRDMPQLISIPLDKDDKIYFEGV